MPPATAVKLAMVPAEVTVKMEPSNKILAPESTRAVLEKVDSKFGCVAGASSDFFPIYRKHRSTEMERLAQMDKDWDEKLESEAFQAKREAGMMHSAEATASKRAKRQRRKEAKKTGEQMRKEADGINKFAADGSFFEALKGKTEEELKEMLAKQPKPEAGVVQAPVVSAAKMSSASNMIIRDADD
mmetsp:Transcript_30053/g.64892  ORF Transcript_30053/g.64892 Transcript_30053/m.64892 type:complete len:186 (-) Transcript_30053:31-588(-)